MGRRQAPESSGVSSQLLILKSNSCGGISGPRTSVTAGGASSPVNKKQMQEGLWSKGQNMEIGLPRSACTAGVLPNSGAWMKERNSTPLVNMHFVPFEYWETLVQLIICKTKNGDLEGLCLL